MIDTGCMFPLLTSGSMSRLDIGLSISPPWDGSEVSSRPEGTPKGGFSMGMSRSMPKHPSWGRWMAGQMNRNDAVGEFVRWWRIEREHPGRATIGYTHAATKLSAGESYWLGFRQCRREFTAWRKGERL